jgi:hypothetical protein
VQWIAVADDPSRATHAVDVSAIGDTAVRSLVAHERYLRGAASFGGRPGVGFELMRGPAAPET